ncbi:hypothetical protein [Streptomyces sp. NPDC002644]
MIGLFSEALPEFLGSLCATLVITTCTWDPQGPQPNRFQGPGNTWRRVARHC